MTSEKGGPSRWFGVVRGVGAAMLVVGLAAGSVPARAQEREHDQRDYRAPEHRPEARPPERRGHVEHERRATRPDYGYDVPTYVPDPPPVVYAPAPPPPGISLMFNFR